MGVPTEPIRHHGVSGLVVRGGDDVAVLGQLPTESCKEQRWDQLPVFKVFPAHPKLAPEELVSWRTPHCLDLCAEHPRKIRTNTA
jgi:hypothetical protein